MINLIAQIEKKHQKH